MRLNKGREKSLKELRENKQEARTIRHLETQVGIHIVKGWILDGVGPARYGYGRVSASKIVWLGKTLAEVKEKYGY